MLALVKLVISKKLKNQSSPSSRNLSKSIDYLCRGQVHLIDLSNMNPVMNVSPDGKTPYKYLLVYIDHFTKKLSLAPLINKTAYEVCEALLDIFLNRAHHIFCILITVVNFVMNSYFSTLETKWHSVKIVHGKPRHPETQGEVERVNREIRMHSSQ